MTIETAVVISAEIAKRQTVERALRDISVRDLASFGSDATRIASEVKQFVAWLDDPLPEFSDDLEGEDKFASLIEIARQYQDCNSFFFSEVGVNASTVWRWASGKSRPSRYVGTRLTEDIRDRLADALYQLCLEVGLAGRGR